MKSLTISIIIIAAAIIEWSLFSMWQADRNYAYGKNLDSVSQYAQAYSYLARAVEKNPDEPTFRDELSYNESVLASATIASATESAKRLASQAIEDSNQVVAAEENSMPFWKTRTRVFYQLSNIDPKYNLDALGAIQKAAELAPTDAKVHYNLGVILARTGQVTAAIKAFEETVALKPDYRDAYTALVLYYNQAGDKEKAVLAQKWLDEHK